MKQTRRVNTLLVAPKKGIKLETHPIWMCFVLGVCERESSTKTPTLGVFELEKGH